MLYPKTTRGHMWCWCCNVWWLGLCFGVVEAAETPEIGTNVQQMYPDFRLPKLDGEFGRLSDYRGNKVLLIHFASW